MFATAKEDDEEEDDEVVLDMSCSKDGVDEELPPMMLPPAPSRASDGERVEPRRSLGPAAWLTALLDRPPEGSSDEEEAEEEAEEEEEFSGPRSSTRMHCSRGL